MPIMRNRKRQMVEGIELANQQKSRMLGEKKTYKYLKNEKRKEKRKKHNKNKNKNQQSNTKQRGNP